MASSLERVSHDPEILTIVRRFSDKVSQEQPEDSMAQALGVWEHAQRANDSQSADNWAEWLSFAEEPSDLESREIEKKCREVAELWRTFKSQFSDVGLMDGVAHPPSISTLQEAVSNAQLERQNRKEKGFGKVKENVSSFIESLEGHKALFSVFPSGNLYTSLIVGVVSSIVKVSTNHTKIDDGFSQALANISCDLRFVRGSTRVSNTPEMRSVVVHLYLEVFEFLCHSMRWYQSSSRRFRAALNSRFYGKEVEERVIKMQRLVRQASREAQLQTQLRIADLQRNVADEVRGQIEEVLDTRFEDLKSSLQLLLGQNSARFLHAVGQAALESVDEDRLRIPPEDQSSESTRADEMEHETAIPLLQTRTSVCQMAQKLQRLPSDTNDRYLIAPDASTMPTVPEEVVAALSRWTESEGSCFLWIEGPVDDVSNAEMLSVGRHISTIATATRIPAITHVVGQDRRPGVSKDERELTALVDLHYALIQELANILPETFGSAAALSEETFSSLDAGSTHERVDAAQCVIDSLLERAPPAIICVIHGIERFSTSECMVSIAKLINVFRKQRENRRYKFLFTTAGASFVLGKKLEIHERVSATRLSQKRAGSPLPGGASISAVRFGYYS